MEVWLSDNLFILGTWLYIAQKEKCSKTLRTSKHPQNPSQKFFLKVPFPEKEGLALA